MKHSSSTPTALVGFILLMVASLGVMANAIVSAAMPAMRDAFAGTPHINTLIGLVVTLPSLGIVLTAGPAGWLNDRFGRRPVMLAALALYAVAGLTGFVFSSLWTILAGRFLLGIAIGGTMTSAMAMIGDRYEGVARIKFMSTQAAVMSAASMMFLLSGGVLGEIGWRFPFLMYGLGLLMIPVVLSQLSESRPEQPPTGTRDRLDLRPLAVVGVSALMAMVLFYMLPVRLPFHLAENGIASPAVAGLAVAVGTLTMSLMAVSYSRTGAKLPPMLVYAIIFGLTAVGFFIISQSTGLVGAMIGTALAGAGNGWLFPANNLLILERAPPHQRGRASGFHTTCIFTGQFLSPILSGPLVDRGSVALAFLVFAGVALAAVVGYVAAHVLQQRPQVAR
jgi:MFS family permease